MNVPGKGRAGAGGSGLGRDEWSRRRVSADAIRSRDEGLAGGKPGQRVDRGTALADLEMELRTVGEA